MSIRVLVCAQALVLGGCGGPEESTTEPAPTATQLACEDLCVAKAAGSGCDVDPGYEQRCIDDCASTAYLAEMAADCVDENRDRWACWSAAEWVCTTTEPPVYAELAVDSCATCPDEENAYTKCLTGATDAACG